jgi:transcriptional regulator with XRE-family HTH domain
MFSNPQQNQNQEEVIRLRQEAGRWLKELREKRGFTQRDMANRLNFEYYTFISQIESGRGRVPPHQYAHFARVLDVPQREFVKKLMRFYDPITYEALFESEEDYVPVPTRAEPNVVELSDRIARLEALLAAKSPA